MTDYENLEQDFDKKVKELQDTCPHKKTHWAEHWWAIAHSSGYSVLVCDNCRKTLEEKPTKEEREKTKQKWLDEHKHEFNKITKGKKKK